MSAKLFVLSAPSGCGKTTIAKEVLSDPKLSLAQSVSVTTRLKRPREKDGKDYFFISEGEFRAMIKRRELLEYEENFGNFYGTPKEGVDKELKAGRSVLLTIDVKGGVKVKRKYGKRCVLIFLLPPSIKELERRLRSRKSDDEKAISARLKLAAKELSYKERYDYKVKNDTVQNAFNRIKKIIIMEKGRK